MVKLGTVSLDGTKVNANASLSANCTLNHLEQEVDKMLSEAAKSDARLTAGRRTDTGWLVTDRVDVTETSD